MKKIYWSIRQNYFRIIENNLRMAFAFYLFLPTHTPIFGACMCFCCLFLAWQHGSSLKPQLIYHSLLPSWWVLAYRLVLANPAWCLNSWLSIGKENVTMVEKHLHEEFLVLPLLSLTCQVVCFKKKKKFKENIFCLEKRESHRKRGDSHSVHQLARPWGAWRPTPAPQAAEESERFQQLLQRPHCGALQVNGAPRQVPELSQSSPWGW